jgi:formylglycine-generating enzyme required for sulfatase activity
MKQNYKISLCALLLVGAASMMTAGAQAKPTLAVFVVGMDNTLGSSLATALGTNFTSSGCYALTTVNTSGKLTELQSAYTTGGRGNINRNALAAWGRAHNISAICLVVDEVKGNDHLFSAQLIDTKDGKLDGRGHYVRTGVGSGEVARVSLALARQLEVPKRRRSVDVTPQQKWFEPEMVFVKGGTFTMGCVPERDGTCLTAAELPAHSVTVSSFSIGKYEVTQAQWVAVKGSNPSNNKTDDQLPVENITWYEAVEFCNALSEQSGLTPAYGIDGTTVTLSTSYTGYRLPTEAEWEYTARGCKGDGSSGAATCENFRYSGSNNADEVGWHAGNSSLMSHPAGQKKPNGLGIFDMSGNVWEWTYDRAGNYTSAAATNPTGPETGNARVPRGGSRSESITSWLHIAGRPTWDSPSGRNVHRGLRVALPAQ